MSDVLTRLATAFLAPDGVAVDALGDRAAEAPLPSVAVLCRAGDAWAAGGALALALAGGPVVVAAWGAGDPPAFGAPATVGARRLAGRLAARGHRARATGRVVQVPLLEGAGEVLRVAAAAGRPTVAALAGVRDEEVDAVVQVQDRVVAVAEPLVAGLAADSIAASGTPARTLELPAALAARAAAGRGVALLAPLRAAVEGALG